MGKFSKRLGQVAKGATNLATIGSVAYKAFKVAKTVASLVNVEYKLYDVPNVSITSSLFSNTGSVGVYTTMAQGNNYNERNGNSILPKSFHYNLSIYNNATNYAICRIIFFRDMEPRQATPAVTDVLETATPQSPLNHINGSRFRVLKDMKFTTDAVNHLSYFKTGTITFNKPGKRVNHDHIRFIGTGAGIANADEGHIFVLFISDQITANAPNCVLYTRLRYIDN